MLYLRARPEEGRTDSALLQRLRDFGIRNATDLHRVLGKVNGEERDKLLARLDPDLSSEEPRRLHTLFVAMQDEDWLRHLLAWRAFETDNGAPPIEVDAPAPPAIIASVQVPTLPTLVAIPVIAAPELGPADSPPFALAT